MGYVFPVWVDVELPEKGIEVSLSWPEWEVLHSGGGVRPEENEVVDQMYGISSSPSLAGSHRTSMSDTQRSELQDHSVVNHVRSNSNFESEGGALQFLCPNASEAHFTVEDVVVAECDVGVVGGCTKSNPSCAAELPYAHVADPIPSHVVHVERPNLLVHHLRQAQGASRSAHLASSFRNQNHSLLGANPWFSKAQMYMGLYKSGKTKGRHRSVFSRGRSKSRSTGGHSSSYPSSVPYEISPQVESLEDECSISSPIPNVPQTPIAGCIVPYEVCEGTDNFANPSRERTKWKGLCRGGSQLVQVSK
ncbi:hypothetical protein IFM89_015920 [Coptis chinensis]|uniref:Uncharacterized protein n=1 Tax=Coptis chinensis TaxID=261450 RepID=A0A835LW09_9MAGN|nr:hypothetical protein IFM89_015920 [Coptis chinensis]